MGRRNLPAGAIGHNTYATSATTAAAALANPVTYTVSGALLQTGPKERDHGRGAFQLSHHADASFELTGVLGLGTQPQPDTTPPVITLLGSDPLELTVGAVYANPGATANDDVNGDISGQIVVGGDTVDTSAPGSFTVTYNVSDAAGNPAAQVTRTVNVSAAPDSSPVIALLGAIRWS